MVPLVRLGFDAREHAFAIWFFERDRGQDHQSSQDGQAPVVALPRVMQTPLRDTPTTPTFQGVEIILNRTTPLWLFSLWREHMNEFALDSQQHTTFWPRVPLL